MLRERIPAAAELPGLRKADRTHVKDKADAFFTRFGFRNAGNAIIAQVRRIGRTAEMEVGSFVDMSDDSGRKHEHHLCGDDATEAAV